MYTNKTTTIIDVSDQSFNDTWVMTMETYSIDHSDVWKHRNKLFYSGFILVKVCSFDCLYVCIINKIYCPDKYYYLLCFRFQCKKNRRILNTLGYLLWALRLILVCSQFQICKMAFKILHFLFLACVRVLRFNSNYQN